MKLMSNEAYDEATRTALSRLRPIDKALEMAFRSLGVCPTEFEKCCGFFGVGERALLALLIRTDSDRAIEAIADGIEELGRQPRWVWDLPEAEE